MRLHTPGAAWEADPTRASISVIFLEHLDTQIRPRPLLARETAREVIERQP